jgi:GT2 family glycosyltransferase
MQTPRGPMQLSVIIVSHNTRELLAECLRSLADPLAGVTYEVCVIDNASHDASVSLVEENFPSVRLIRRETNTGFAAAMNAGLAATTGEFVCWLNPDARLFDGSIAAILHLFAQNDRVGVIGPRIVNADQTLQFSCRAFPSFVTAFFGRNSVLSRWFPRNPISTRYLKSDWDHASTRKVDWVSGACLFHRRVVSDELSGVDERFFMYMEDLDFCLRATQIGWEIVYEPAFRVMHLVGGSSRHIPFRSAIALHRSIWRYYAKHFRRSLLIDSLSAIVIAGRCLLMLGDTMIGTLLARVKPGNASS